ncbi:hypothetical protein NDR87_18765 [Nocardia sp. CDC159]|uniref:Uncharacterized protein n=1 Tax=Nocardia pulmonis TaxID=2951408 RepID=A0A9X2E8U1_9NOCA|nr:MULTISPECIES: hypothetical protein [Nocardia]MCM6776267.1 hypothetical protein [Nocardia pulmonis]MCM6788407.1 hypothetical protein [Nocardia sp. CDC159]
MTDGVPPQDPTDPGTRSPVIELAHAPIRYSTFEDQRYANQVTRVWSDSGQLFAELANWPVDVLGVVEHYVFARSVCSERKSPPWQWVVDGQVTHGEVAPNVGAQLDDAASAARLPLRCDHPWH